ncbi:MAG TPA: phosphotransferase [Caulobacteraceae bacterium]
MSSPREAVKADFLNSAGLAAAAREPLPGDASTRCYERLRLPSGATLMLMDAPPRAESAPCPPDATPEERIALGYNATARLAAGRVDAFAACANFLRERGLSAPEVIALDAPQGLAVVEDLGERVFAHDLAEGADPQMIYGAAIDALADMHACCPPERLNGGAAEWPLLSYDELALKTGADLLPEWLPKLRPEVRIGPDEAAEWDELWGEVYRRGEARAEVFCHRDYHAENLIWLPEREGPARVGMVDFQDAVRAHPAWDLLSLLQDARRDVPPELERAMIDRYMELRPQGDRAAFLADYVALAALNQSRIIGVFARLITRDSKPRYGEFLPRVWAHLERDLEQPGMEALRAWFDRNVPVEART